jgi:hypothetical protein
MNEAIGALSTTASAVALVITGICLTLILSSTQAFIGARVGSDHPVHVFLTQNIRANGYRLFVRVPRLLNISYCAALPLYMHWIVSHFRAAAVYWCERLLNPVVNMLHVGVFGVMALLACRAAGLPTLFVGLSTCAFALTPQFYHALSARNFGLSSRGTGLLFLTLFFLAAYAVEEGTDLPLAWPALVLSAALVWGFSTFAQQALCILSAILAVTTERWIPLLGTALGLALFVVVHPRYSLGYLRHTLRFIRSYRSELAAIYILPRRPSIWRDLVWDIWVKARGGLGGAARYAYENSVLVVIVLNPLLALACWAALAGALAPHGLIAYAGAVALAGAIAAVVTSFRATRFLGEPERYVEAITPWSTLCASYVLFASGYGWYLAAAGLLFLLMDLAQLYGISLVLRRAAATKPQLNAIEAAVRKRLSGDVRFCSNNEHFTKLFMQNGWQYAYCLAAGQDYCGMKWQEAFTSFPHLRREACERIVATYRVNACLLDRTVFETVFDDPPCTLREMTVAYESPRFRLLILDWSDAPNEAPNPIP